MVPAGEISTGMQKIREVAQRLKGVSR